MPISHCRGPCSVPGNKCGIYGAQCETWADSSPSTSFYSCQYHFTNAPYLFVSLQMTESLNNTRKMDWACSISVRRQGKKDQKRDGENNIKMAFRMIGKCRLSYYRQSLAFVNTVKSLCCFEKVPYVLTSWAAVSFEKFHYCILDLTHFRLHKVSPIVQFCYSVHQVLFGFIRCQRRSRTSRNNVS